MFTLHLLPGRSHAEEVLVVLFCSYPALAKPCLRLGRRLSSCLVRDGDLVLSCLLSIFSQHVVTVSTLLAGPRSKQLDWSLPLKVWLEYLKLNAFLKVLHRKMQKALVSLLPSPISQASGLPLRHSGALSPYWGQTSCSMWWGRAAPSALVVLVVPTCKDTKALADPRVPDMV